MLRRRIFSSAMASVMALSSVAVVANAEDTQMKTKADLEKLVNETYGSDYRVNELSEYGSISAEAMLDAIEHGEAVLADADATDDEATVAYMMIVAVEKRLVKWTAEDLKTLMAKCKSAYDSNNILNEELQDNIWTPGSYSEFTSAYENADLYVTSTSSVDITEAYEKLNKEFNDLDKLTEVTKSDFRAVMKQYEAIIAQEFDYEDWRRGNAGYTGKHQLTNGDDHWKLNKDSVPYGSIWEAVMSVEQEIEDAYDEIDAIKGLSKTTLDSIVAGYKLAQDAVSEIQGWTADDSSRATKAGVNQLLTQYHSCLVADFATTTAQNLYDAIVAAAKIKSGDTALNISYNTNMLAQMGWAADGAVWESDPAVAATKSDICGSSWNITMDETVFIAVDKNGMWLASNTKEATVVAAAKTPAKLADENFYRWMPISKGSSYDLVKLIPVDSKNVLEAVEEPNFENGAFDYGESFPCFVPDYKIANKNTVVSFVDAYAVAMDYLNGDDAYYLPESIDTTGVVVADASGVRTAKGNSKEWALVYRYLKYALADRYATAAAPGATYTRADVKALLEDCYILAEETGNAAIFNLTHVDLVEVRKEAQEWLADANADKKYKDGVGTADYVSSTSMYETLKKAYDKLNAEYQALRYSFDDIQNKIAEVAGMIDDGDLEGSADLLKALDETAYCLSVVADDIVTSAADANPDNPAFDVDRVMQINNRLITTNEDVEVQGLGGKVKCVSWQNSSHYNLLNAYNALVKAVEDQTSPDYKIGDVNKNGRLDSEDAAMVLKHTIGLITVDEKIADWDEDGVVESADASAILKASIGLTE